MTTRQEVIEQVTKFVNNRYGGDWRKAFDAEDSNGDGRLTREEVSAVLAKAGVGLRLTRWAIALEVITAMDADGDGGISFDEFMKITHAGS
jgi:Ca2+-binding EF-hand superfamily protein